MRGKYICLEGGDGTGKSTLAKALIGHLGDKAVAARFPSDGQIGKVIREGLMGVRSIENKPFLYLFAADGLQEELWIQDQLEVQEKHIICDRHPTLSGRVFQPMHHPEEHIEAVYNSAAEDGVSMPDYLFIIDVPVDVAIDRMRRREKYQDIVFEKDTPDELEIIRHRYLQLAKRFGGVVLDGARPTVEIMDDVLYTTGLG